MANLVLNCKLWADMGGPWIDLGPSEWAGSRKVGQLGGKQAHVDQMPHGTSPKMNLPSETT